MVNTTTGRCLVRQTAFRPERWGRTRLRAAAAFFSHLRIRPTLRFRSTTARDRTSSRRICASLRPLGSANPLEERPRDRGRAVVRAVLVVPADRVVRAVAAVVPPAVVVDVVV